MTIVKIKQTFVLNMSWFNSLLFSSSVLLLYDVSLNNPAITNNTQTNEYTLIDRANANKIVNVPSMFDDLKVHET